MRSWTLALAPLAFAASPLAAEVLDTAICAVQGSGSSSPLAGQTVTVRGVVTADLTRTELHGFFLQDPTCDGDPLTSDGVFVDTGTRGASVTEGRRVTVTGRVAESADLTTIVLDSVADAGSFDGALEAVPLAVPVDPAAAAAYLEAREGMLVGLPQSVVVGATDRAGETWLMPVSAGAQRLFAPDARLLGLLSPGAWRGFDQGDKASSVAGPLTYLSGAWRVVVRPRDSVTKESAASQPTAAPAGATGELTLASYDLDGLLQSNLSPDRYAQELARRARSIARLGLPDVVAVQEVGTLAVLQDLATQPDVLGAGYQAILIEGPDEQGLDVGLLYKRSKLFLLSSETRQACTDLPGALPGPCAPGGGSQNLFQRPPLVAKLRLADTGEGLTLVVNHFRARTGDAAQAATLRLAQAQHVRALVDEARRLDPAAGVIVLGNLNDTPASAPLATLTAAGALVDLHGRSSPADRYTCVDSGISEAIDYVLVDAALAPRVAELREMHVNADFAEPGPADPVATSQRASSHDPPLVRLR